MKRNTVLFAAIALWLCIEMFIVGPFSVMPIFDYADSWLPIQQVLKANIFSHGVTNWFPSMGCGVDRLAQDHFYPYLPNLLSLMLPVWLSNPVAIFFQYFLAMFFMFRLCTAHLGMSDTRGILAGTAFAVFCEFNPMLFGVYAFPLTLYCFRAIYHIRRNIPAFFLTICLGMFTASASLVIYLPYTLPMVAVWFLFAEKKNDVRFWSLYALYCLVILVCKVPSLMALLLNADLSHRNFLIPGYTAIGRDFYFALMKRLSPWLFPSVVSTIVLVLGVYCSRWRDAKLNRFFTCFLLTTVGACLLNLMKFTLHLSLAGYQLDRFFLISPFFYALCLAYAVTYIPDKRFAIPLFSRKIIESRAAVYLLLFLSLFVHTALMKVARAKEWVRHGSYYANYHSSQLQQLASMNAASDPFRVATAVSLIFPTYAMAYGLESADAYANLYPMRYKQFWSKVILPLTRNNEKISRYFNNWGNRVYLFPPPEVSGPEMAFTEHYNLNLLSLANTKYIISRSRLVDHDLRLVQQPQKEFYRLSRREQAGVRMQENFAGNNTLFVYENPLVLPRFFVTRKVMSFESDDALLDAMSTADVSSLRETLYINKTYVNDLDLSEIGFHAAEIALVQYSPDVIRVNVTLDGKGFLIVSNSYSPFWKVDIDRQPGKIIPADHAFWGVYLDKGEHQVHLYYDPPYKFL